MLVLTRKLGEEIRIGDEIVVKVTGIQGGRVRLGIEAPRNMKIVRPEAVEVETASEPQNLAATRAVGNVRHASALH